MQKDGNEIAEEVRKVNGEFYHAFESLSIDKMDKLWNHDENIICIHPGWDLFTGWLAIRESWITIFSNTEMIRFTITNTIIRIGVIATNVFERNESNRWRLIHHHGSPVANYLPPNISSQ